MFAGNQPEGHNGHILVNRGNTIPNEHKFYVALSDNELQAILKELEPVLITQQALDNMDLLLAMVAKYKD